MFGSMEYFAMSSSHSSREGILSSMFSAMLLNQGDLRIRPDLFEIILHNVCVLFFVIQMPEIIHINLF
jgi:hypothetical protein